MMKNHFFKKFILPFSFTLVVSVLNTSCLKKQNLEEEDLGPAIEAQELTKVMSDGHGSLNYTEIKSNEFNSYVLIQKIQDSYVETVEQQDILVNSSTDTADKLVLDVIATITEYNGGQSSQGSRQWSITFNKESGQTAALNSPSSTTKVGAPGVLSIDKKALFSNSTMQKEPYFLFVVFQSLAFGACVNSGEYPESCHKLSSTDIQYPVPFSAKAQHNCAADAECFIKAKKIEFDMIRYYVTDKDGKPKRTHYTLILSQETPYLSRVLKFCSRGLYDITNGQKILADLCYNVNNYAFGNPTQ